MVDDDDDDDVFKTNLKLQNEQNIKRADLKSVSVRNFKIFCSVHFDVTGSALMLILQRRWSIFGIGGWGGLPLLNFREMDQSRI